MTTVSLDAQTVTPASGGTGISADNFATGTWTTLNGPIITETAPGQIQAGQIRLEAPTGFEWDTGGTTPTITVGAQKSQRITANYVSRTSDEVVFSVNGSSAGSPPNNIHTLSIGNLRIRPTQGTPLISGNIRNLGSSVPGGTINYGTLSITAGADANVRVESDPDASGTLVAEQDLEAGQSLTVYANVRDQFNNFKRTTNASWALTNNTGGINPADLSSSGNTATLTANFTGTTQIQASVAGINAVLSGTITVIPSDPASLTINTQPSSGVTAGQAFPVQPVVEIRDAFSNLVTTDDFSLVTASVLTGNGSLSGTRTVRVSNGLANYADLFATVSEVITLEFTSPGLGSVTSDPVTVNPAPADSLIFLVQPGNAGLNTALDPSVEIQLVDEYSNTVTQPGVAVSLNLVSGTGNISGNTAVTNASGLAVFNSLSFDQTGTKIIDASSNGLNNSVPSNSFTIANAGQLAGFRVVSTTGGNIGSQTAGIPFNIRIEAVDGFGALLDGSDGKDNFTGNADLSTNSIFSTGTAVSNLGPFVNGVLDPVDITLLKADPNGILTATNSAGTESGSSDAFIINPAQALADSSFFSISTDTLIAGSGNADILITLRDEFGNPLKAGGDNVTISRSGIGTLSPVTDNGDGTYSATITAPNNTGSAIINVFLDSSPVPSNNPQIIFTNGPLSTFLIEAVGGGPVADQIAGVPFDIQITAKDAFGNTITEFDSTNSNVIISSDADLIIGEGSTPDFTDGLLSSYTINISKAGNTSINARWTANPESGSSNVFNVNPAEADPANSTITPGRNFLQNDGSDNTSITVQLFDEFGNSLTTGGDNVVLNVSTGASLSSVTDNGNGTYTAQLTAGVLPIDVTVSGVLNGSPIGDTAVITLSLFNVWDGNSGGGNPAGRTDWGNPARWSLGIPTIGQVVLIPSGQTYYPIIDGEDPVLDILRIESGASVVLTGRNLTINNEISGLGSFSSINGSLNIAGNSTISNLIAGSSTVNLNGDSQQTIAGDFSANLINVQNDLEINGFFETFTDLNIDPGTRLDLIEGSELFVIGDINLNGSLNAVNSSIRLSGNINGTGISLTNTALRLDGSNLQLIEGISSLRNLTIDNPAGVQVLNDLTVTDTLFFSSGTLTLNSGLSLVSTVQTGNTQNLRILREITGNQGWRLLSSPQATDYGNFLDGVITQGYNGAFYSTGSLPGDTLQPNVFYYDETFEGTDNQRFRAPSSASEQVAAGRGHFVYLFDDIPADPLYNTPLPDTLDVLGSENDGNGFSFNFPVTYTPEADTGWNLVGNPFAATIDWDDGNWTKQNMDNVIYIWDESANDYLTWNGTAGSLGEGRVKPFQAFWVKANGNGPPRLRVDKETKTVGGTFYKEVREDKPVIELLLESGDLRKTTHMSFQAEGSYGKDTLDAYRLLPFDTDTYLELYTLFNDGTQISINNLPRDFGIPIEIPLYVGGFDQGQALNGPFELSWPVFQDVPDGWTILLIDRETGTEINMKEQVSYSFNLNGSRSKASFIRNTIDNFKLIEKNRSKISSSRFMLNILPGEDADGLPSTFELYNNYPNPFNASTTIRFATPLEGPVNLEVYDVLGRKVATLADRNFQAGYHDIRWSSSGLASGIYIYRLVTSGGTFVKKMSLIK
ncbi:invasin domain 3-containing protein [Balneola sp. MJW-20]|uniref:invasin domain 3-containing protein n=1 Tax=Gracilimonas aurantiaca TaxID=3234185 RepID=UPI003466E70B